MGMTSRCTCIAFGLLALVWALPRGFSDMEQARVRKEKLWQRSTHQMASVEVNKAAIGRLLAPLLSYKFLLPMPQLRAGFAYAGMRLRLRRFVRDLLQGHKPLKVSAIGGSVTWGQGATNRTYLSWFGFVGHWLKEAFPHVNITVKNGAVPATPASYMVLCMDNWVDPDVDLVLVEYILNNGFDDKVFDNQIVQVMERLIRRLLALPGKPAVVLMQVPSDGMAKDNANLRFHMTMEDLEGSLAQYYDVQYLSLRTALYRLAAVDRADGFTWEQTFADHHPGDAGHRIMADLVAFMLQDTAVDLLLDPLSNEEKAMLAKPLQPPMYKDNEAPQVTMCYMGDAFRQALVSADGFEYLNEGNQEKPKWGFVADKPGSRLVMRFITRRPHLDPGQRVSLYLQFLKSYEHMGVARVSCTSGCGCDPVEVDAHTTERVSQTYQVRVQATQSDTCEVTVDVLDNTRSGEHKFKVIGAVIAEDQFSANILDGTVDPTGKLYVFYESSAEDVSRRRWRSMMQQRGW